MNGKSGRAITKYTLLLKQGLTSLSKIFIRLAVWQRQIASCQHRYTSIVQYLSTKIVLSTSSVVRERRLEQEI